LNRFRRIIVLGAGKASAKMAQALERVLGDRISDGFISVKTEHTEPLMKIRVHEAGHPVPDVSSIEAANEIMKMASKADSETSLRNQRGTLSNSACASDINKFNTVGCDW
jgi:glycerate 2-kinase